MDRLSTSAREWTPGGATTQSSSGIDWHGASDSDLNAAAVKEFVPGKGWSVAGGASAPQHQGE